MLINNTAYIFHALPGVNPKWDGHLFHTQREAKHHLFTPLFARAWRHAEMWWPRLFEGHPEISFDDYEKDYSDLPETVLR